MQGLLIGAACCANGCYGAQAVQGAAGCCGDRWRRVAVLWRATLDTLRADSGGLLDGIDTPSTVVVDRHGRVLYEALSQDGSRVRPLDAASLPPVLEAATIAAEDRRFYVAPRRRSRCRSFARRGTTWSKGRSSKGARRSRSRSRSC